MKIAIDCRMLDSSGVGVYLRGCLPFFIRSGQKTNFLLIGSPEKLNFLFSSDSNVEIIDCGIKPFSLREYIFFPKKCRKQINTCSVYFSPFFNVPAGIKIPVYTTIHDIIFPDMTGIVSKTGLAIRMRFFRRAYKISQKIFTVSLFSKSRIEHHLGKNKPVIVTYSAVRNSFFEYRKKIKGIKKTQTIIFIGNIKKHKGLDYLLDAFFSAKAKGLPHKLVIIGSRENFRSNDNGILKKAISTDSDSIFFTDCVSDEELMRYYAEASLLVQPSLYEGFCLPPLEAMVLGTKALISDIPVLKEIYADYPVTFFNAGDSKDLKNKIMDILYDNPSLDVSLPQDLMEKYSFEKTASIILKELDQEVK